MKPRLLGLSKTRVDRGKKGSCRPTLKLQEVLLVVLCQPSLVFANTRGKQTQLAFYLCCVTAYLICRA